MGLCVGVKGKKKRNKKKVITNEIAGFGGVEFKKKVILSELKIKRVIVIGFDRFIDV
jgi:hypothetical protein